MKIIISPSKTKCIQGEGNDTLLCKILTEKIALHMQAFSKEELGKILKIKGDILTSVYDVYQHWNTCKEGAAITSYEGLVYKHMDWQTLSQEAKRFGREHLRILSAMYGVLTPDAPIKNYRLDLENKVRLEDNVGLRATWMPYIEKHFQEESYILNVASKEYSNLITHENVLTVQFLELRNGALKAMSTSSKIMRGRFVRHLLSYQITSPLEFPREMDGFILQDTLPQKVEGCMTLSYVKEV